MFSANFNEWTELREFDEMGVRNAPRQGDIIINKPSALFSKVLTRRGNRRDYTPRPEDTNMSAFRVGEVGETSASGKAILNQRHARPVNKQFRTGKLLDASDLFDVKGRRVFIYDPHNRWSDMLSQAVGPDPMVAQPTNGIGGEIDDMAQLLQQTDDQSDFVDNPHVQQKAMDPAYQQAAAQQGHDQLAGVLQQAASKVSMPEPEPEPTPEPQGFDDSGISLDDPISGDVMPDMGLAASHDPTVGTHGLFWKTFTETTQNYEKFPTY